MSVNYVIRAEVVDIQSDAPRNGDVFMVDSNVWFWMTYVSASTNAMAYQTRDYPEYVNKALALGVRIFCSGLSMAELTHLIETNERKIYSQYCGSIGTKEYRHNLPTERERIVKEIEAAWVQVKTMSDLLELSIDDTTTSSAINRLQNDLVDGYDLFILETIERHKIPQVITDDGDFTTISGVQIFTANRTVLNAARSQGKLVVR
ncbi:MAG: PIN domain-containing protein [Thermodesulfobacteriota bacterium]|nr:PIN domain-containing protein [Thermodesulfobacteriota bacterium]